MKKQKKTGQDMDKALAKVASVNLSKNKKLQTDEPLAEKLLHYYGRSIKDH